MIVIRGLDNLSPVSEPSVVTIGVFDGVHLGHRAIMQRVLSTAESESARAGVITFDRNPDEIVHPKTALCYISTLDQKLRLIEQQGMDFVLLLHLSRELIGMPAEEFVTDVLHEKLCVEEVVVGSNFAFGKGRAGTARLLEEMGAELGFSVTEVSPVVLDGDTISSTEIRRLISAGDIERANAMLGHRFVIEGEVVEGQGLGRRLGFPTANVRPARGQILPAPGVYLASVRVDGDDGSAVVNVGYRPTVGGGSLSVEVYILGFSGNIYGQKLEVAFQQRLRGEIRFPSIDALVQQIRKDVELASTLASSTADRHLTEGVDCGRLKRHNSGQCGQTDPPGGTVDERL